MQNGYYYRYRISDRRRHFLYSVKQVSARKMYEENDYYFLFAVTANVIHLYI